MIVCLFGKHNTERIERNQLVSFTVRSPVENGERSLTCLYLESFVYTVALSVRVVGSVVEALSHCSLTLTRESRKHNL